LSKTFKKLSSFSRVSYRTTTEITEREIELAAILKCCLSYTEPATPVFLILSSRQAARVKGERLVGHQCAGTSYYLLVAVSTTGEVTCKMGIMCEHL